MPVTATPFWRRRRIWIVVAIVLSPFIFIYVCTSSFILSPFVASMLHNKYQVNVEIGSAQWGWSNGLSLENVVFKGDEQHGSASEVITVQNAIIHFESSLPVFNSTIDSVEIDKVIIRLAESADNAGEFNFTHLFSGESKKYSGIGSSAETFIIPELDLSELAVEIGLIRNGIWTRESTKNFTVERNSTNVDEHVFTLVADENQLRIELKVQSTKPSVDVVISNLHLNNSVFDLMPRTIRAWCEATKLQGAIHEFESHWDPVNGMNIEVSVKDIGFVLPEEHSFRWAHYKNGGFARLYGDASMDVTKGTIVYDGQSVSLNNIQGSVRPLKQEHDAPLKFHADMKIKELPSFGNLESEAWMKSMLKNSPFEAKFFIDEFQSPKNEEHEVDLPIAAAQILKIFQLEDWSVLSKVEVKRLNYGGEIDVQGDLRINAASGMYENFKYPLREVNSYITFHQDEIQIVYMNAVGNEDATVYITGDVQPTNEFLVVDLDIHVDNAPLDSALHDAVPSQLANVMDSLFDREALVKMGRVLPESPWQSFSLGGKLDFDFDLFHDSRNSKDVEISGEIEFENIGMLHQVFPYPVTLQQGRVILETDGISIPEGENIRFEGAGGGKGELGGAISFLELGDVVPDLSFNLINEWITPTLIEAISVSAGDSYNTALGVLGGLGLESRLTMRGNVRSNDSGEIGTNFTVLIGDGTAILNEKFAKAIGAAGPFWPDGFEISGVNALVKVQDGAVSIEGATCACGYGAIELNMTVDGGEFDLQIWGKDLPLSPQFVDVLPQTVSRKLSNAWHWLNPAGEMDAEIRISHSNGTQSLYMEMKPTVITVSGKDETVNLELLRGSVVVEDTHVYFNNLDFQLQTDDSPQGLLQIKGDVYAGQKDFKVDIGASWKAAAIDSPLTRAITAIVGGQPAIEYYDSLDPAGHASATLEASGNSDSISYDIEIVPSILSATFHGRRANASFTNETLASENIIRFDDEGISFEELSGKLGDGDFRLFGNIDTTKGIDGEFDLVWIGTTGDESLMAVLPSVVGDTLKAIEMSGGVSELPNGKVYFDGESWSDLKVSFAGDIALEDVTLDVGVPLEEIKGQAHVKGMYSEDKLSELKLILEMKELMTLGREVTNVVGTLELDQQNQRIVFKDLRGNSNKGSVAVEGWIAVDDSKEYEVELLVAGVELATSSNKDKKILASLEGELTAWLSLAGVRGELDNRRGAGLIHVKNGHFEADTFSLKAMQLMHFAIPSANSITGARIVLYVDGPQVVLEEITMKSSDSNSLELELRGEGIIDIETFELHARLHPRAGWPIIRDIVGLLNDQLYSIDVTGELFNPKVSIVPLPFLSPQEK